MPFEPKCVLVTGATSNGIGQSLATSIYNLACKPKIIVTGRRQEGLDAFCAGKENVYGKILDQNRSRNELSAWVADLISEHPDLDTVILNAGVQLNANFAKPHCLDLCALEAEIYTNYTSQMILISAVIPHLIAVATEGKVLPRLATVTSGLSIVPKADVANYCASKSALHSLTLSLRTTLAPKGIKVIEIVPPRVATELENKIVNGGHSKMFMPLPIFTDSVMKGFQADQDVITVGRNVDLYAMHEGGKQDKVMA